MPVTKHPENSFPIDKYIQFKGWLGFGALTTKKAKYYASMLFPQGSRKPTAGLNILELGYGNGSFLSFCRDQKLSVIGVEINNDLLEIAKSHGYCVYDESGIDTLEHSSFDFIVALDVFEHLASTDILALLSRLRYLLRQDGQLIARFPNGDSPFSLHDQNADPTHITHIGSTLIISLSKLAGYKDVCFADEPLILGFNPAINLLKIVNFNARSLLNLIFRNLVYRGTAVNFFSPTTVVKINKY